MSTKHLNKKSKVLFARYVAIIFLSLNAIGCGEGRGAKPGDAIREANLPLFFTVAGQSFGQGAVYKISSLERGALSTPELVIEGLDFPAGLTLDESGTLYITEKLPAPDGKIKKIERGSSEAVILVSDLHNPVSVAVDSLNHVYVNESDSNRISRFTVQGTLKPFPSDGLALPRDMLLDSSDHLILTELDGGVVSSIDTDGKRTILARDLLNPFGLALNAANELFVIVNASGGSDGSIVKINGGQTQTMVEGLTNPIAMSYNNAHGFFIIEGSPANRIINYSLKTGALTVVALTGENPYGITMSPY